MPPLRCIHIGVGGRGAWPVQVISQRDDYETVALVDVDQPARVSEDGGISRPSGREQMAAAQKVSGLGDAVCFLGAEAGTVSISQQCSWTFKPERNVEFTPASLQF